MAYSLNQVILMGYVGKDPEIRAFQDGGLVANFQLATTQNYKSKDSGEWKDITDWHSVRAYGNQAQTVESFVKKGQRIQIIGTLKNNNYTDKTGVNHYGYYIQVEKLFLLDKAENSAGKSKTTDSSTAQETQSTEDFPTDEISF